MNGCTFTNTSGKQGGGIALSNTNAQKGEINGCTFDRCTATNQGGGIFAAALELIIDDYTDAETGETVHTEVKNCTASNEGGGIYQTRNASGSSLSIRNAVITGNQTKNGSKNGGGVYAYSHSLTIEDSDISRNTAAGNGGGVWFDVDNDTNRAKLKLTIKGSTIDGNTSNVNPQIQKLLRMIMSSIAGNNEDEKMKRESKRLFKEVQITMDETNQVAKKVELIEKNGDITTIEFTNVVTK